MIQPASRAFVPDDVLTYATQQLRSSLGPNLQRLVLFGSRARQDASPDSDYDLLMVVERHTKKVNRMVDDVAGDVLLRFQAILSTFPVTKTKLRQRARSPFIANISREGIEL